MKKHTTKLLASCLSLLLILLLLAGCGAKSDAAAAASDDNGIAWDQETGVDAPAAAEPAETAESESQSLSTTVSAVKDAAGQSTDFTQKIIYSGRLHIETTSFDQAMTSIDKLVTDAGGFVESSEVSGYTSYQPDGTTQVVDRYADYTLRVPSSKFQSTMSQAGAIGNVTSSGTDSENITSQYIDQEARRDSLEVQEERLLAMLEKSEDVETLVALESRLSEVRYEIESIERQLRNWQMQVDYSTIHLTLEEVAVYTPTAAVQRTFGEKMSDALGDGWHGFVRGIQNLSISLARSLPALVILALIAAAAVMVVRKLLRRRKPKQPHQEAETPPDSKP